MEDLFQASTKVTNTHKRKMLAQSNRGVTDAAQQATHRSINKVPVENAEVVASFSTIHKEITNDSTTSTNANVTTNNTDKDETIINEISTLSITKNPNSTTTAVPSGTAVPSDILPQKTVTYSIYRDYM